MFASVRGANTRFELHRSPPHDQKLRSNRPRTNAPHAASWTRTLVTPAKHRLAVRVRAEPAVLKKRLRAAVADDLDDAEIPERGLAHGAPRGERHLGECVALVHLDSHLPGRGRVLGVAPPSVCFLSNHASSFRAAIVNPQVTASMQQKLVSFVAKT